MILLFALAQAASPPPPAPLVDDDVVVIARKLGTWRGMIRTNPFGTKCVTKQSTGDREIDAIGCTAMERCWPATLPRMKAAHARGVAQPDRQRLEDEATRDFATCAKPVRNELIDALHDRRAATRERAS